MGFPTVPKAQTVTRYLHVGINCKKCRYKKSGLLELYSYSDSVKVELKIICAKNKNKRNVIRNFVSGRIITGGNGAFHRH